MNAIKEINRINQRELELGLAGKGSWHDEYKDSAYVFVGGLANELTEGDVIQILSQFGEVVDINLPRDKETGKTRGFGFVMYEDQRSTILAVDNLNGAQVLGRSLRVDHCRKYNQPGTKNKEGEHVAPEEPTYNAMPPIIEGSDDSDSDDTADEADDLDDEDPMAAFIRAEKKKAKLEAKEGDRKKHKRKHEGESKEERRARKEAKRAKRAEKERKKEFKRDRDIGDHRKDRGAENSRNRDGERRDRDDRSEERDKRTRRIISPARSRERSHHSDRRTDITEDGYVSKRSRRDEDFDRGDRHRLRGDDYDYARGGLASRQNRARERNGTRSDVSGDDRSPLRRGESESRRSDRKGRDEMNERDYRNDDRWIDRGYDRDTGRGDPRFSRRDAASDDRRNGRERYDDRRHDSFDDRRVKRTDESRDGVRSERRDERRDYERDGPSRDEEYSRNGRR